MLKLFATYAALLVLFAATLWVAYVDLSPYNLPVALLIASAKAALVGIWFMHLSEEGRMVRAFAGSGLVFVALLISLTLVEAATR